MQESRARLCLTRAKLQGLLQASEQNLGAPPVLEERGGGRRHPPLFTPRILTATLSLPLAVVAIAPTMCGAAGQEEHGKNMAASPSTSWEM